MVDKSKHCACAVVHMMDQMSEGYTVHSLCACAVKIIFLGELLVAGHFTQYFIMYKKSPNKSKNIFMLEKKHATRVGEKNYLNK